MKLLGGCSSLSPLSWTACVWQHLSVLPQVTLDALVDELRKLAEAVTDKDHIKKILQPGDILFTRPRNIKKLHHQAFYAIESRIQGSPYTHVGMYAGDDKVIDAGTWTKQEESSMAVHEVPLDTFSDRYRFKVLRVNTTPAQKREAVQYAKSQVGKDFNMKGMLRLIFPFKGQASDNRERKEKANDFFCSELVANAYSDVGLAQKKKIEHVMPVDIHRSTKTRTIVSFE